MIDVVATIQVKPGRLREFLEAFKANVPAVLAEDGCFEYYPTVDAEAGLDSQRKDANAVTVVEKWESVEALHAHLKAPHMARYREAVKELVEGVNLKVLERV